MTMMVITVSVITPVIWHGEISQGIPPGKIWVHILIVILLGCGCLLLAKRTQDKSQNGKCNQNHKCDERKFKDRVQKITLPSHGSNSRGEKLNLKCSKVFKYNLFSSFFLEIMTEQTVSFWCMNAVVPPEVQHAIDGWKQMVAEKYDFVWNEREDEEYVWNVWEYSDNKPVAPWKDAGRFIPPVAFRMGGLVNYQTPIGTVWSLQLLPPPPFEWLGWGKLMTGILNRQEGWIPRLTVSIGSTKPEDKLKTKRIMTERTNLPWKGHSWTVHQFVLDEPVEEGCVCHTIDLKGVSLAVLDEGETIEQEVSDRLFQMEGKISQAPVFNQTPTPPKPVMVQESTTNVVKPVQPQVTENAEDYPPLVTVPEGGRIQARTRQPWGPRSGNNSPNTSDHEKSQESDEN